MTVNESVAVTWSSNAGINAKFLTAQLGYSHTSTHSISDSQTVSVPQGRRGYVTAWALHRRTTFDVYRRNIFGSETREGNGESFRPNGVRFDVVIR